MSAAERINGLIKITKRLSQLLRKETEMLKFFRRPSEISFLQEEKSQLSTAYQNELTSISASGSVFQKQAPKEMDLLRSVIKIFKQTLDEHNRALFAAKTVTERMIRAVSEEAARRNRPPPGYSHYAAQNRPAHNAAQPISIALNEVV